MGFFTRKTRPVIAAHSRPRSFRPHVESLEARDCPAGGLLDSLFHGTGIVNLPSTALSQTFATTVQPDGKVIAVGRVSVKGVSEIGVVRLNQNGSLDATFNKTGALAIGVDADAVGSAVVVQPDGKIVVGGNAALKSSPWNFNPDVEYAVVRLNANGTLDTSFGNVKGGGVFTYNPTSGREEVDNLALLPDGSIIASGAALISGVGTSFSAFKLTASGALNTQFGSGGRAVVHVGANGTPDTVGGMALVPGTNQVALVGDVGGQNTTPAVVIVLNAAGHLDTTFHGTGYLTDIPPGAEGASYSAVVVQPTASGGYAIVATGSGIYPDGQGTTSSALAARYTLSGSVDTTFGGAGTGYYFQANVMTMPFGGAGSGYTTFTLPNALTRVALEKDGSLVFGGYQYYWDAAGNTSTALVVAHMSADGVLDTTFGSNGGFTYLTAIGNFYGFALDPNGGIVASGAGNGATVLRLTHP